MAIIETDVARGMGFVVDPAGYVVTNRHVIEDADHIESVVFPARDPWRRYGSVRVVYMDPDDDLALLYVHSPTPLVALPLATDELESVSGYLALEDPVVVLQREETDQGPALTMRHGRVAQLHVSNPAAGSGRFVGMTLDVHRGQSGGPVLDRHGRAVGVVTWAWRERGGGFAIPIVDAMRMMEERPHLEADAELEARARLRATRFLEALAAGDGETARRLTSPSQARKHREDTVDRVMADTQEGDGLELMGGFVQGLEDVVDQAEQAEDPLRAQQALGPLVMGVVQLVPQTEVGRQLEASQVVSFFHVLGEGYLLARLFGGQTSEEALGSAMLRLRTIGAAQAFGLAALVGELEGEDARPRAVELLPGAYAPTARVELGAPGGRSVEGLALILRLEWGDWYVASVEHAALD
ncbi:S1 family peptidase [Paraliomyxa miuraensis]|uniref:S1 family peptidase n=1 Tax=Paraliomyxa miuraensis TaxID=376150 RepID=UPI00224DD3D6|nr:serine protease [Paraliomyxa miuraensis]MCX4239999.1 serine protease [Paraliomyxa miuraensis]